MRAVVQRVSSASVTVEEKIIAEISDGLVVLLGIGRNDDIEDAHFLASKIATLRIFEDDSGKMNLSIKDIGGKILAVSQFTLYGDCRRGRRPSFTEAAGAAIAEPLYLEFGKELERLGIPVKYGKFGAFMLVNISNDGPVTLLLNTHSDFCTSSSGG